MSNAVNKGGWVGGGIASLAKKEITLQCVLSKVLHTAFSQERCGMYFEDGAVYCIS